MPHGKICYVEIPANRAEDAAPTLRILSATSSVCMRSRVASLGVARVSISTRVRSSPCFLIALCGFSSPLVPLSLAASFQPKSMQRSGSALTV